MLQHFVQKNACLLQLTLVWRQLGCDKGDDLAFLAMEVSAKRGWQGGSSTGPANKRHNSGPDVLEDELIADAEAAGADMEAYGEDEADVRQEEELDFELDLGEAGRNWERPTPPDLRPSRDPISTQFSDAYCWPTALGPWANTDLVLSQALQSFVRDAQRHLHTGAVAQAFPVLLSPLLIQSLMLGSISATGDRLPGVSSKPGRASNRSQ